MTILTILGYLVIVAIALAFTYLAYSDLRSVYYLGGSAGCVYLWASLMIIAWAVCYALAPFTVVWKG